VQCVDNTNTVTVNDTGYPSAVLNRKKISLSNNSNVPVDRKRYVIVAQLTFVMYRLADCRWAGGHEVPVLRQLRGYWSSVVAWEMEMVQSASA
jgi:hypothetical protein